MSDTPNEVNEVSWDQREIAAIEAQTAAWTQIASAAHALTGLLQSVKHQVDYENLRMGAHEMRRD
jgi:hypothetical protein